MNADRPEKWPEDVEASCRLYNRWYMEYAPAAYEQVRREIEGEVQKAIDLTDQLRGVSGETLRNHPSVLSTLRMCTSPPLAVDRIVGLSGASKSLVQRMDKQGKLRKRISKAALQQETNDMAEVISEMLDDDLFPWVKGGNDPDDKVLGRARAVVADRLCASLANPVIRNAQEERQLKVLGEWLEPRGYRKRRPPSGDDLEAMQEGTYAYRLNVEAGPNGEVNVPVDAVIQPCRGRGRGLPVLIEAKSAGDFTNTNKRRKEEATKVRQLRERWGDHIEYILLLGGFFGTGYLEYEARAGIDWVWEHRIDDLGELIPHCLQEK